MLTRWWLYDVVLLLAVHLYVVVVMHGKPQRIVIFTTVFLLVRFACYRMLWRRLLLRTHWWQRGAWVRGVWIVFVLLGLGAPLLSELSPSPEPSAVTMFAWWCFGVGIVLFLAFLLVRAVAALLSMCTSTAAKPRPRIGSDAGLPVHGNEGRAKMEQDRQWSVRLAVVTLMLSSVFGIGGWLGAMATPQVLHRTVYMPHLPCRAGPGGERVRMVHVSDLHFGTSVGKSRVDAIVDQVLAQRPDVVVLVGDICDGPIAAAAGLGRLRDLVKAARFGVYYVDGNHEHINSGAQDWFAALSELGVTRLHNSNRLVTHGFVLAGVSDPRGPAGPDVEKAVSGVDPREHSTVLLAHQPKLWIADDAASRGVFLMMSGHTHGGQVYPMVHLASAFFPKVAGWYTHTHGTHRMHMFVSRGAAYWGPPLRFWTPSDIGVIDLSCGH